MISEKQVKSFEQDGFLKVEKLFSEEEIKLLYEVASDGELMSKTIDLNDQTGKRTKLALWYTPGEDSFGIMCRSERILDSVRKLTGDDDICHFHSKLMQKEPHVGGAWEWHQDYGYWYKTGFLFPEAMVSVMIALSDANKENGCLQVLKGTHKMQRIEHNFIGEQQGADPEFVEEAKKISDLVYCELKAGDALFFHSNILHRSDQNLSDQARWSIISVYNAAYNKPFRDEHESCTTPLSALPDATLLKTGKKYVAGDDFLDKEQAIKIQDL